MTLNGDKSWLVFREDYIILFYYFHTNFIFLFMLPVLGLSLCYLTMLVFFQYVHSI